MSRHIMGILRFFELRLREFGLTIGILAICPRLRMRHRMM
jgi:hypothetical protein